jgi:hypothetical protein
MLYSLDTESFKKKRLLKPAVLVSCCISHLKSSLVFCLCTMNARALHKWTLQYLKRPLHYLLFSIFVLFQSCVSYHHAVPSTGYHSWSVPSCICVYTRGEISSGYIELTFCRGICFENTLWVWGNRLSVHIISYLRCEWNWYSCKLSRISSKGMLTFWYLNKIIRMWKKPET